MTSDILYAVWLVIVVGLAIGLVTLSIGIAVAFLGGVLHVLTKIDRS